MEKLNQERAEPLQKIKFQDFFTKEIREDILVNSFNILTKEEQSILKVLFYSKRAMPIREIRNQLIMNTINWLMWWSDSLGQRIVGKDIEKYKSFKLKHLYVKKYPVELSSSSYLEIPDYQVSDLDKLQCLLHSIFEIKERKLSIYDELDEVNKKISGEIKVLSFGTIEKILFTLSDLNLVIHRQNPTGSKKDKGFWAVKPEVAVYIDKIEDKNFRK